MHFNSIFMRIVACDYALSLNAVTFFLLNGKKVVSKANICKSWEEI